MKFAKLFDVADTQVLVMLTGDEDGDVAIKTITMVDDALVGQCMALKSKNQDEMQNIAIALLEDFTQEKAQKIHEELVNTMRKYMQEEKTQEMRGRSH